MLANRPDLSLEAIMFECTLSSATTSTIRLDFVIDQNVNKYQKISHLLSMRTSVYVDLVLRHMLG